VRVKALAAGAAGAVVGGVPSTLWALARGRDPLEATLAAGSLLLPHEKRRARLLAAAVPVHLGLSLGWSLVLDSVLPRGRERALGAPAGLAIAALDLVVVGRRFPRLRAVPLLPQVADHVAYALTVGEVLRRARASGGAGGTHASFSGCRRAASSTTSPNGWASSHRTPNGSSDTP
jgi:hypothetical protein